ncbi:hypothetical protein DSCA_48870 [Desulfosarcina alkanivorans]|uniref:Lipoprotein n=1 Tax=Desulfosarcina alkanivorans TaxID=571177 RepID=A0A5K7Z2T1_9BACT|nr:hypothetical protein [Desulfosarcina alkanivorans]BBO70957.1 hypothetical protein DSCA_48870 [Desulfosarcina alkanivorans]
MTKSRPGKPIAAIGILLPLLFGGCAARNVTSQWHTQVIVADGSDAEWSGSPQFYDKSKKASIRLSNDAESIQICFATGDRDLKMRLATEGLSLWLDPDGGKNKVVGIYVPGKRSHFRPADKGADGNHEPKPQELRMPATIEMTYSDTTGPLKMDVEAVRRTGIGIGVGQPDGSRYVYEFIVPFAVDEILADMGSGKEIGVGILPGNGESEKSRRQPSMGSGGGVGAAAEEAAEAERDRVWAAASAVVAAAENPVPESGPIPTKSG